MFTPYFYDKKYSLLSPCIVILFLFLVSPAFLSSIIFITILSLLSLRPNYTSFIIVFILIVIALIGPRPMLKGRNKLEDK